MSRISVTIEAADVAEADLRELVSAVLNEYRITIDSFEIHDEPHPAYRNVQSGRYVSAEEAGAHPDVTVREGGE